ncbi:hypothetical protein PENTCL1PPCAC_3920, partial [Pristionchus entomophagus]
LPRGLSTGSRPEHHLAAHWLHPNLSGTDDVVRCSTSIRPLRHLPAFQNIRVCSMTSRKNIATRRARRGRRRPEKLSLIL